MERSHKDGTRDILSCELGGLCLYGTSLLLQRKKNFIYIYKEILGRSAFPRFHFNLSKKCFVLSMNDESVLISRLLSQI